MEQQPIDYSRKWYVMAVVAMSIFISTIDESGLNVALPTLVHDFQTNFATIQWVILAYLLTQTVLMLSIGRLGDMLGNKLIYITGFIVFIISSVLCGLAPSVYWLIGFRVLQAIGAAMILALAFAVTTEAFPPAERGKALGMISTIVSIGVVIGPTLGGLMVDLLSWRWIFYINLPIGLVGTLAALHFLPNFKPAGRQTFDYFGAVALLISLLALLLALTLGQALGFGHPYILLLFGGWAIFLAIFIRIEWSMVQPMIELRLFRNWLLSINLVTRLMTFVAIAGTVILLPFYLQNIVGYDTRQVGLLMVVTPIGLGLISPISGILSDRFGPRLITVIGLGLLILSYYFISTLTAETLVLSYILHLLPLGISMGIFQSPNNSAVMGSAPRERLGITSGLLSISRTLGQTVGVAVIGAVWAGRTAYHAGGSFAGGVTTATTAAQMAGLQETFLGVAAFIGLAFVLSLWGWAQERGPLVTFGKVNKYL